MYIHIASRTPRPKKTSNLQYRDNFRVVAERSLQWLLRAAFRCKAEKLRRLPECTSSGKFYSSYSYRRYRSLKVTWSYYASIRFNAPTSFPEQMRAYQFRMPPRRFLPIVEKLTQDGFFGFFTRSARLQRFLGTIPCRNAHAIGPTEHCSLHRWSLMHHDAPHFVLGRRVCWLALATAKTIFAPSCRSFRL